MWLISETHDSSGATAKGYRPHAPGSGVVPIGGFAGCLTVPVRGDDWRGGEIPTFLHVVVDEVLEQHLIYVRPVGGPGDREDVVDQGSDSPMAGLEQRDCRWAKAQLALTESRTGGGWEHDCRTEAPDQLAGFCRREKERRVHVAEAKFSAGVGTGCGLPDDGLNDPRDQHPFFADT